MMTSKPYGDFVIVLSYLSKDRIAKYPHELIRRPSYYPRKIQTYPHRIFYDFYERLIFIKVFNRIGRNYPSGGLALLERGFLKWIFCLHCMDQRREAGSGLLELVIGVSLSIILTSIAASEFLSLSALQKMVSDRSQLLNFEQSIRRTLHDNQALRNTAAQNVRLRECLLADNKNCRLQTFPLQLWDASNRRIDGRYFAGGSKCALPDCPIEIQVTATPTCKDPNSCDQMRSLAINYAILVDGVAFKTGMMIRQFQEAIQSDVNRVCQGTGNGITQLAYRILPGRIDCSPPPPFKRSISGITPGDCKIGEEVLVGFDPGSGSPICQPIKFDSNRKAGGG